WRRKCVRLAAATAVGARNKAFSRQASRPAAITAQDIVERIRQHIGVEWKTETVDTFKAGDPGTIVKGIVTTAMPTINVLKQAVQRGANFVIACEPTFYSKSDAASPPAR